MTIIRLSMIILAVFCFFAGEVHSCSPDIVFRSYLDMRFWQPYAKYWSAVLSVGKKQKAGKIKEELQEFYFAGTSDEDVTNPGLMKIGKAYNSGNYVQARKELAAINKSALTPLEKEELYLVDAKLDMRNGEKGNPVNKQLLKSAQKKLAEYLKNAKSPQWRSEARGWLAHVHYLLGEYPDAVKIYLDELGMKDTIFDEESIIQSLHIIFIYNGSDRALADHLEEYFDTPVHALFVVYLVTNPLYQDDADRAEKARNARKTIGALQKRSDLFNKNRMSDVLALALMRAALYMGDTQAALNFSKKIPAKSKIARCSEYNWMVGACHFLRHEYAAAEEPLLKVLKSNDVSKNEYREATQGLMGVYQKLGRRVDQLHAAFAFHQIKRLFLKESRIINPFVSLYGGDYGPTYDVPYLLDIQLSDDELREYLARYEKESKNTVVNSYPRKRTACEAVKYALAVRYARQERYREAAEIYAEINARPRAARMKELAGIYDDMTSKKAGSPEQWGAQYKYAAFLEEHSTQVFFNDMFWNGFQTWVFLNDEQSPYMPETSFRGLTKKERDYFLKEERRIRDEQEERWRAYHILNNIVEQAGYSKIGEKAAMKALKCLAFISQERFAGQKRLKQQKRGLLIGFAQPDKKHKSSSLSISNHPFRKPSIVLDWQVQHSFLTVICC